MSSPSIAFLNSGVGVAKVSPDIEQTEKRLRDVVSDIREVLAHRGEVTIALEHDALRVVVVEEVVVLQRVGVLRPHRVYAESGEPLELLELALVDLESGDGADFSHGFLRWFKSPRDGRAFRRSGGRGR